MAIQKRRNGVMHRAESINTEESKVAVAVASYILEELFPSLVKKLGFHIHENGKICNKCECGHEELLRQLGLSLKPKPNVED